MHQVFTALTAGVLMLAGCSGQPGGPDGGGGGTATGGGAAALGGGTGGGGGTASGGGGAASCPAPQADGVLSVESPAGDCQHFTFQDSTVYHGAFLTLAHEGLRLDLILSPDHSRVDALYLHRSATQPVLTCFLALGRGCAGVTVSGAATKRVSFDGATLVASFGGPAALRLDGTLVIPDPGLTNTFVPIPGACAASADGLVFPSCAAGVLADFTTSALSSPQGACTVTKSGATLTVTSGTTSVSAVLDAESFDALRLTVAAQLHYGYRLDAWDTFAGNATQVKTQVALSFLDDGLTTVTASSRATAQDTFSLLTCSALAPDQPWSHAYP